MHRVAIKVSILLYLKQNEESVIGIGAKYHYNYFQQSIYSLPFHSDPTNSTFDFHK